MHNLKKSETMGADYWGRLFRTVVIPAMCIIGLGQTLFAGETRTTRVTRWVSPDNSRPVTYEEWKSRIGAAGQFRIERKLAGAVPFSVTDTHFVLVAVNSALYDSIYTPLQRYVTDLGNDGYRVEVYATSGGTPEDFRSFLQTKYAQGLDGCTLVGDLPVPWYQCIDDFEDDGIPDGYEEFPIDLYYADMDGNWTDSYHNDGLGNLVPGPDGILDAHVGNVQPEIWVGRLTPSPLVQTSVPEAILLQLYFDRDHRYRLGELTLPDTALVYIDDDWASATGDWGSDVGLTYPDRVTVADIETTRATDYRVRLDTPFHSVLVCVHSSPGLHAFKYNNGTLWEYMYVSELPGMDPEAFFYNLFACSNARYVEPDYMGGWYVFCQSYGLGAIGSTKTGSMLDFEQFYEPLGEGANLGEAMRDWWVAHAPGGYTPDEYSWFYGMTLLGDPTLTVRGPIGPFRIVQRSSDDDPGGNGDGILDPGETIDLTVTMKNVGDSPMSGVTGTLRSDGPYATVLDSVAMYGDLAPGSSAPGEAYRFQIAFSLPGGCDLPFILHVTPQGGSPTQTMDFRFTLKVERYDYIDHDLGNVVLTVTKSGALGYLDPLTTGSGFLGPGSNRSLLYQGSLFVGNSAVQVADDFGPSSDWTVTTSPDGRLRQTSSGDSLQSTWAMFCDSGMASPAGLRVRQIGQARTGSQKGDFVLLRYEVSNGGTAPLSNTYLALFADFDVFADVGYSSNLAGIDSARQLAYVKWGAYNPCVGLCLAEGNLANLSVIENNTYLPRKVFPDSTKFRFMDGTLHFSSGPLPQDYSAIVSCGPYALAPGDSENVSFAVLYGQNIADLQENADSARSVAAVGVASPTPDPCPLTPVPRLLPSAPNPFSSSTVITYELSSAVSRVSLGVYNLLGQCVRTLISGPSAAGRHAVTWDGRDERGSRIASGVYFCGLEVEDRLFTKRLTVVKQ